MTSAPVLVCETCGATGGTGGITHSYGCQGAAKWSDGKPASTFHFYCHCSRLKSVFMDGQFFNVPAACVCDGNPKFPHLGIHSENVERETENDEIFFL